MYDHHELAILSALDQALLAEEVRSQLAEIVARAVQDLEQKPEGVMSWEPVPLGLYGSSLPPGIKSSWVFILRAGATTGAERHPNSRQRVVSFHGTGDLQVDEGNGWQSNVLVSDANAPLLQRWASVPENTWHQAVVPEAHWAVVSFHTVLEGELIEERPVDQAAGLTRRRLYLA